MKFHSNIDYKQILWEPYTPEVQWFKDEAELSSQTEPILHLELEELLNI